MSADEWDERYRGAELVWGAKPNRWVEQEVTGLVAGRALDLACGEGRNSVWLAQRGWQVTGVDFSAEAISKARALAAEVAEPIEWLCADATQFQRPAAFDLALIVYLQLAADQRRAAVAAAWAALAPGGTLIVVAHDSDNLAEGVGGPQDPAVLYTAADVAADLATAGSRRDDRAFRAGRTPGRRRRPAGAGCAVPRPQALIQRPN